MADKRPGRPDEGQPTTDPAADTETQTVTEQPEATERNAPADDGPEDTSGRPPLADVAQERVANRNPRVYGALED